MPNTKRVSLTFDLDNGDERQVYELLQNMGYRNKTKGLVQLLSRKNDNQSLAEEIAEKVVSLLKEQSVVMATSASSVSVLPDQQPKRKRGRPRKNPVPADAAAFTLLKEQLIEVLGTLTEREQKVLRLRFGLDDGRARTLEEVGKEFNVTRERIRQIEAKALRKLRHPSRSRKLKDYLD